jgi:hypothetical protein
MLPTWVNDSRGTVYINDFKRYVKGVSLVPPVGQNPLVTAAAPGATVPTQSTVVIIEGGEDSVSEIFSIIGAHDAADNADVQNRLSLEILDKSYRRVFMNRPILANHVFGTPLNPFFLLESILLESQQVMALQFFNNSTLGSSNFRLQFEARKFQAAAMLKNQVTQEIARLRKRKLYLNPFWLTSEQAITLPAGGSSVAFFRNSRDYFLVLNYIMAQAITTGVAGDTQEVFSFQLFDAKTDRPLMNQPVTMNTGTGTSAFPYVLPAPLLVEPVNAIRAQFTNLITDAPTEVFFTFHGVGIFVSDQNPWHEMQFDQPAQSAAVRGAP